MTTLEFVAAIVTGAAALSLLLAVVVPPLVERLARPPIPGEDGMTDGSALDDY